LLTDEFTSTVTNKHDWLETLPLIWPI